MLVELLLLLLRREHRRQTLAVCQQAVGHKLVRGRRHRRGVGGTEQLVEDGLLGPGDAEGRHSVVDDVRHILGLLKKKARTSNFFGRTGLPLARTRLVQSTFSSHCPLINIDNINSVSYEKISGTL